LCKWREINIDLDNNAARGAARRRIREQMT